MPALGPRLPGRRDLTRLASERVWTSRALDYAERLPGGVQPRVRLNSRAIAPGWFEPESELIWLSARALKRNGRTAMDRALRHLVAHQVAWTIEGTSHHDRTFADLATVIDAPVFPLSRRCVRRDRHQEVSR